MADYENAATAVKEIDLAASEFADNVDKNLFDPNLHESVRKSILVAYKNGLRMASRLVMESMGEDSNSIAYIRIMDLYNELVLKLENMP